MLSFGEAYGELKVFEDGEGVFLQSSYQLTISAAIYFTVSYEQLS